MIRLADHVTDELVVTWGTATHDWFDVSDGRAGNLSHSGMGSTIPLSIGLAKALPDRNVIGVAGDGDVLMQLAGLPSLGREDPENLVVIINDNESYQTGGDHPTMTGFETDLEALADASGVTYTETVETYSAFETELEAALEDSASDHARFIVVKTDPEPVKSISKRIDRQHQKYSFIRHVEETEDVQIFP